MLIQFSLENYGPFADRTTLNMVAMDAFSDHLDNLMESGFGDTPNLLRSTLIFGPNASGKSMLLKAMSFFKRQTLFSHRNTKGFSLSVAPFLLDAEKNGQECRMEFVFIADNGFRYQYGFSVCKERFPQEWLHQWNPSTGTCVTLFTRKWNEVNKDYDWSPEEGLQTSIPSFRQEWLGETLENQLFISVAGQKKQVLPEIDPVLSWFRDRLTILHLARIGYNTGDAMRLIENPNGKQWLLNWMASADLAVSDIEVETIEEESAQEEGGSTRRAVSYQIRFTRLRSDGKKIIMSSANESRGTMTWFRMSGYWKDALENDRVVIVDELERDLHSFLVEYLIDQYHSPNLSSKAQLISTTHALSLMDKERFRQDQIRLLEKDRKYRTTLYSLGEFTLPEGMSFYRAYQEARVGGIPIIPERSLFESVVKTETRGGESP
ncbi:MAG: AAA family ATPase [Magnetococcales bacterium]|nr:AAA family ATPase [Magnetococcales bacterium]